MHEDRVGFGRHHRLFILLALTSVFLMALILTFKASPAPVRAEMPQPVLDEIARLDAIADGQPVHFNNPHPRHEAFINWPSFDGEDWKYFIINGNSGAYAVNGPTTFDNTSATITADRTLKFTQVYDPDHEAEYPNQYNNVAMIGMQGYMPTDLKDILWNFQFRIEPGFHGSTGFVIEPQGTFAAGGTFALPFDMFGITVIGNGSAQAGLQCMSVINWIPLEETFINNVDPFQWNEYEIRFHLQDAHHVIGTVSINESQACQMTLPNYSQTEIQIWSDNYVVTLDPAEPNNLLVGFGNWETAQSALFDDISAKAHP